ncbi:unnamed protein product [Spirodela intermedia]|uniref:NB-ARC domain-containing protein n=1 Tax=Spirodela intermedia TaxID=51605 RepID=A0A7I8LI81_SPIIN|nr:unnamed protein product [Spirodela intermedia]
MNPFLACLGFFWDPLSQGVHNFLQSSTGGVVSCVWNLAAGGIVTLILLDSRAEELGREMKELTDIRADLLTEIRNGKLDNKGPTQQAKTWLDEQNKIEDRVDKFRVSFQQRGDSSEGCSLLSSYRLCCEAAECLKEVQRLKTQKNNLPLLIQAPPPAVVPLPSSSVSMVGEEETLSEIRRLVEDDEVGIIGIYGLGGVGKTTLLKAINHELHQRGPPRFDLVIWATVSKEGDILEVRPGPDPSSGTTKQGQHHAEDPLPEEVLLLDDLWDKLDLGAVGVPFSTSFIRNGSKIVFTTRSEKVCNEMDAQRKVKVPLLNQASSWTLFCQKLGKGEDQWDPFVRSLAEAVAKKCGGLPITLITVGRAMAEVTSRGEWEEALMALKGIPAAPGDMEEKVLKLLKFSFDRLKDTSTRECLLYCALFPRGWEHL